ncbi:MAG: phosphomannomutase/phosphoglucomutase, partial [Candidatus Levyibacteriota bacterium]
MDINPAIFKAYDIRGTYPDQLNEENIVVIAKAIYTFFKQKIQKETLTIALGGDMRTSTPSLQKVVKQALVAMGAHVVDVGLVSTPTFYFSVFHYGYDAGIQISASHNPKEYNGMKFVRNTPDGLIKIGKTTGMEDVKNLALAGKFEESTQKGTVETKEHVVDDEVTNAFDIIKPDAISPLTIVADAANAMGAVYLDALFQKLPCKLVKMNFNLDGTFPAHQPDPLQKSTLVDLQKKVLEEKADIGIAPDGDGDRIFFIDEKGDVIPASVITALVITELLKKYTHEKMVFDVRYTWTPTKATVDGGGTPV